MIEFKGGNNDILHRIRPRNSLLKSCVNSLNKSVEADIPNIPI